MTAAALEMWAHWVVCVIGFVLVITRIQLNTGCGKTREHWAAWVAAHSLLAVGFFVSSTRPLYGLIEPRMSEWFIRLGIVIYLALALWIDHKDDQE